MGCSIKPEVVHAETEVQSRVQDRGAQACQGTRGVGEAGRDLGVHENVVRKWVKEFGSDPVQAFPGQRGMKPEQIEIERLRREVYKLKAERAISKNCSGRLHACAEEKQPCAILGGREAEGELQVSSRPGTTCDILRFG